jgi:PKHD-type hydroxylase
VTLAPSVIGVSLLESASEDALLTSGNWQGQYLSGVYQKRKMTTIYPRPLLTETELSEITRILENAQWEHSATATNVYLETQQKNSEMAPSPEKTRIAEVTMAAINRDDGFRDMVFPKHSTGIIVSKTEINQGFQTHHDSPSNGDYSTTVFLSDPSTYLGGELTMFLGGTERKFALPAGHALTYDTGIPHCVKEVTEGVRYAIVFWTTSLIKDSRWREVLGDLRKLKKLLPREYTYDLLETCNDPHFITQGIENKLLRHFINQ